MDENNTTYQEGLQTLKETFAGDVDISALQVELPILEMICKDEYVVCFDDIWNMLKTVPEKLPLIPNVVLLVNLLLVNPATSASPERSFSLARRLKSWQR